MPSIDSRPTTAAGRLGAGTSYRDMDNSASLPRAGWQSGHAEHVLLVDLPDVPTRLLAVTIRVDGPYVEYRAVLDGLLLAMRALTPEQVSSPDAASYRADALTWAARALAEHLLYPLEAAARDARIDVQVLSTFHSESAKASTELFVAAGIEQVAGNADHALPRRTRPKAGAPVRRGTKRTAKKGRR